MKKFLLIFIACMAAMTAMAQTPAFMGIPIDGKIKDFYAKLEAKGFVLESEDVDGNIYTGTFTGEEVTVTVMPGLDNNVAMVGVYLPIKSTWSGAVADFDKYSKIYTKKYGEPDIVTREYDGYTLGSSSFHDALQSGEAVYRDIYVEDDIYITVSLHVAVISDTSDGYQLLILYLNDNNYEEDYSDDI